MIPDFLHSSWFLCTNEPWVTSHAATRQRKRDAFALNRRQQIHSTGVILTLPYPAQTSGSGASCSRAESSWSLGFHLWVSQPPSQITRRDTQRTTHPAEYTLEQRQDLCTGTTFADRDSKSQPQNSPLYCLQWRFFEIVGRVADVTVTKKMFPPLRLTLNTCHRSDQPTINLEEEKHTHT